MNVASVALVAQGGCLSVAATLDAKTEIPAAAASPAKAASTSSSSKGPVARTGMSTGAKIAIVAAVAGGGAGAALALGGGKKSTSP
jgi:hypothetical protein